MSSRIDRLQEIHESISRNPSSTPKEVRKEFWKMVREIKREVSPNEKEIVVAAEIREMLFEAERGRTFALGPSLSIEGLLGLLSLWGYIWTLGFHLDWMNLLAWTISDWTIFGVRFLFVFGVVAFLYPFGRFIAGKWTGIKILGMCRDQYYEPTLKIDYMTFLKAPASKRKWFFFFAGIWTVITTLWLGVIGLILDLDLTPFIPGILLILFEGRVIQSGNAKATGGEMGHYNREKRIEHDWLKNKEDS
ncbi:MAG: hypothetical protein JW779_04025 [Candidatus Thorarchaeota archaeon]|nr:hypothetical protein [Candidatus Thorarchaeota archaeon]